MKKTVILTEIGLGDAYSEDACLIGKTFEIEDYKQWDDGYWCALEAKLLSRGRGEFHKGDSFVFASFKFKEVEA